MQTYWSDTLKAHVTIPAAEASIDLAALAVRYLTLLAAEAIPVTAPLSAAAVLDDLFGLAELPAPAVIRRAIEGEY